MKSSFSNCTAQECASYSKTMLATSKQQWKSARLVARSGDYGTAIHIHIVSMEELVKAAVLALDSAGFKFRTTAGMDVIFRNHGIRHFVFFFLFSFQSVIEDLLSSLTKFLDHPHLILEKLTSFEINSLKTKYYINRKLVTLRRQKEAFSDLDKMRQRSAYNGYYDGFTSPLDISIVEYQDQYRKLKAVKEMGELIVTLTLNDTNVKQIVGEVAASFDNEKRYEILSYGIKWLKDQKGSPLSAIWTKAHKKKVPV